MSLSLSNIRWGWILLGVLIALLVAYGSSICVVTFYAGYLGFQVQGAPDTALINEFANNSAPGITAVFVAVGTLLGGLLAGRKAELDATQNGLMVGAISALVMLLLGIFGSFSLWVIVGIILAVAGGWLGGRLAAQ